VPTKTASKKTELHPKWCDPRACQVNPDYEGEDRRHHSASTDIPRSQHEGYKDFLTGMRCQHYVEAFLVQHASSDVPLFGVSTGPPGAPEVASSRPTSPATSSSPTSLGASG
jgi:hypothetical protein